MCNKHFKLICKHKSDNTAVNLSKKHFSHYLRGFPGAAEWRKHFMTLNSRDEVDKSLQHLINSIS